MKLLTIGLIWLLQNGLTPFLALLTQHKYVWARIGTRIIRNFKNGKTILQQPFTKVRLENGLISKQMI